MKHVDARKFAKFGGLTAVAVGGSLIFGAAVAARIPGWSLSGSALWLTLSAGSGWIVFGSLLALTTRKPILQLAEVALETMAIGECVLVTGAIFDWVGLRDLDPILFNVSVVAVSNAAMAAWMVRGLAKLGVSVKQALTLWVLGLDGFGALFFFLFYRLTAGGAR